MRFVILGAGGIGGVIGARLFEAGEDVTLVARGAHFEAMRASGLRVESPERTVTLPIPVVADPGQAGLTPGDVVVLATKSQDTAGALAALRAGGPPTLRVVCAQNGVENERVALRSFAHVYAMAVMCPTTHLRPGVVQANSTPVTGILDLGRYPQGVDTTAEAIAAALRGATFSGEARPDIMRWKYRKLLLNLGNAIEAVCGPAARSGGGRLLDLVRTEGEACLRAAGIAVATAEEDLARRGELLRLRRIDGRRREGGSSWQSLVRGTGSIESDYLNGEIVLLGRLHEVPTPANELLQRLAHELAADGRTPGSIPEADVLAQLPT